MSVGWRDVRQKKEEAQRLQVNEMNGNLAELKSIVNNPNIPKSEKLKEAQRIMGNTFRAVESFTRFVKKVQNIGICQQKRKL